MKPVTVYGTDWCPFCVRAEQLLARKGIAFEKINIDTVPGKRGEMLLKSAGQRTVPQIFVGEVHIGGFDDLENLDRQGELDSLLAAIEPK